MKVKNIGNHKIHLMITTGGHVVEPKGIFECAKWEFDLLKGLFPIEAVEEEIIESEAEPIEEVQVTKKSGKKAK